MKLEGLRVVDLTRFLPGPLMTQFMADHGAEVIKVESVDEGEPTREIGIKRDGVSVYFANTNRGKKSLALNLKDADGIEVLMRLAAASDVFVESFRPGVAARLGIGYPEVSARAPQIVYASISAFGQSGPYRDLATHDLATEALCGLLSVNQGQDGKPAIPALANADMLAALVGLSGVLMALLRREQTGRGDYLDVAMAESLLACMPNILAVAMAERRQPVVKDERTWGGNALYGIYETRDGEHVALAGQELKFATNLLGALGRPDLVELCKLPPGKGQEPVRAFLREIFGTRAKSEWIEWFEGRDIAFAPLRTLPEMLEDPHFKARGMLLKDSLGWDHLGIPMRFTREPGHVRFEAPAHGAHSAQILRGLGYGEAEIARLAARGVVKASPGRAGPST